MTVMTSRTPPQPSVKFSFGQSSCKGEDVVVVLPKNAWPELRDGQNTPFSQGNPVGPHDEFALFCVFDGHNGVLAAKYISETLLNRLVDKLPTGNPPDERDVAAFATWRQGIVRALAEVLSETHLSFAKLGQLAGCTVTIVLQTGWLVTCANLGDSRCVIDNGLEVICLTDDHRVATNQQERRRVEHTGALIAPVCASGVGPAKDVNNGVGPLRIWPGGVCLSRGIGDFDLGDIIVPWPNVVQVRVPPTGARVMLCSDGVWDAFDHTSRIYKLSRTWAVENVPQRMISSIVRAYGGLRDDTSIVVVDIMPPGREFADNLKKGKLARAASRAAMSASAKHGNSGAKKGGCFCMSSSAVVDDDPTPTPPPPTPPPPPEEPTVQPLEVLAKQDVAEVLGQFPHKDAMPADWAEPRVISKLLQNHQLAFETWKRAAMEGALDSTPRASMEFTTTSGAPCGEDFTVRAGKVAVPPGMAPPPPLPSVFSARVHGNAVDEDISVRAGIAYPAPDLCHVDGAPREVQGMAVRAPRVHFDDTASDANGERLDTNASVRFGRNVASTDDYGPKFGHYHDMPGADPGIDSNDSQLSQLQPMPSLQGGMGSGQEVEVVYGHSKGA